MTHGACCGGLRADAGACITQGRLLHDIFLHLDRADEAFLIEHDADQTNSLRAYLKRHILRSKVKLGKEAAADAAVFAAWRTDEDSGDDAVRSALAWLREQSAAPDERAPGMGYRWTGPRVGDARELLLPASCAAPVC